MAGSVDIAGAVGVYGLSQAGGSLSALPFGIGPADAVVVGLLLRTGTSFGVGTTVALLLRGTVTLPIALAAVAALAGRPKPTAADLTLSGIPTPLPATATTREAPAFR
jgi:hypothetical protein